MTLLKIQAETDQLIASTRDKVGALSKDEQRDLYMSMKFRQAMCELLDDKIGVVIHGLAIVAFARAVSSSMEDTQCMDSVGDDLFIDAGVGLDWQEAV